MKKKFLLAMPAILAAMTASARAAGVYFVDDFGASTLDPNWIKDDEPASYSGGGGFVMDVNQNMGRFNNVGNNAFAHLESATTYDTSNGIRVDATLRQDHYPVQTWGTGVAIYFDANNYVALKQSAAGGASGWLYHLNVNGAFSQAVGNDIHDMRVGWFISGLELTSTQIKFYGSPITGSPPDQYGVTNIDANENPISEFTMPRPASFTGNAKVIIGKGFTLGASYPNPDFDNSVASDMYAFAGVDYARVITDPGSAPPAPIAGFGKQWVRQHVFAIQGDSERPATWDYDEYFGAGMTVLNKEYTYFHTINNRPAQYASKQWQAFLAVPNGDPQTGMFEYNHLRSTPGNIGWLIGDEPNRLHMPDLGAVADYVRRSNPNQLVYTTASNNSGTAADYYGDNSHPGYTYDNYLDDVISICKPDILAYDYYPFRADGTTGSTYLQNVMQVRAKALANNIPYSAWIQSFGSGSRRPSESDNRFNVYTHLTAGYTGLLYWTYDNYGGLDGLIDGSGNPTPLYAAAATTNGEASTLGRAIRFLTSTDVRFVRGHQSVGVFNSTPVGLTNFSAGAGGDPHIQSVDVDASAFGADKNGLIGLFTDDANQHYFMLSNLNHGENLSANDTALSFVITFDNSQNSVWRMNRTTGAIEEISLTSHILNWTLPGGTGDLFKYDNGNFAVGASIWTDSSGDWSTTSNWYGGVPNGVGAGALFGDVITAAQTVTTNAAVTLGSLEFSNANSYTIGGSGSLTIQPSAGSGLVTVSLGSHTIGVPVTLSSNTTVNVAAAASTLNITSDVTATGVGITKTGLGTLAMKNVRANDLTVSGGKVQVTANGTSTGTSQVTTVSIAAGGKLDLTNNKLVVKSGGTAIGSWNGSNYDGVTGLIKSGRNGGTWNGSGIVTSQTAALGASFLTTLAVATAQQAKGITGGQTANFGGMTVNPSDVLVMYTYTGDANLSGKIDADDYFQIDSNYNKTANSFKSYANGDFNYDGKINGDDYFLIDNAYTGQGAAFASGADIGGVSTVPEPASLGLTLLGATTLLSRRARRSRRI